MEQRNYEIAIKESQLIVTINEWAWEGGPEEGYGDRHPSVGLFVFFEQRTHGLRTSLEEKFMIWPRLQWKK